MWGDWSVGRGGLSVGRVFLPALRAAERAQPALTPQSQRLPAQLDDPGCPVALSEMVARGVSVSGRGVSVERGVFCQLGRAAVSAYPAQLVKALLAHRCNLCQCWKHVVLLCSRHQTTRWRSTASPTHQVQIIWCADHADWGEHEKIHRP
jgi:hypothetical protein